MPPFAANLALSGDADGHGLAGLIVGTYRADPNGNLGSLSTDRRRRVRSWIAGCAFLLAVASSPALAETGWSDEGWTVLTVARSGAWGLSTARTQGEAIAGALRQCQGRSADHSDGGQADRVDQELEHPVVERHRPGADAGVQRPDADRNLRAVQSAVGSGDVVAVTVWERVE